MRKLVVFGLIALFIGSAYVPPNQDGFLAVAQKIGTEVKESTSGVHIALGSTPLSSMNIKLAAQTLNTLAKDASKVAPNIDVSSLQSKEALSTLSQAANVLSSLGVGISKKFVAQKPVTYGSGTAWKDALRTETDGSIRSQLDLIELARKKGDVHICTQVKGTQLQTREVDGVAIPVPSQRDFVTYCLARVTRASERCDQIAASTTPPLKELCTDELK